MEVRLKEIAQFIQAEIVGNEDLNIQGITTLEDSKEGYLTFIVSPKLLSRAERSAATAIIVPEEVESSSKTILRTSHPKIAFARALEFFFPSQLPPRGIDSTVVMGKNVQLGQDIYLGSFVTIGNNVVIADGVSIYPGVYIGDSVFIGKDTIVYPNVVIYKDTKIGERVIIHGGSVIGADGFGYVACKDGTQMKIPQTGHVVIEDKVEIGANTTIDKATLGKTIIKRGTKIDNLVQIAHNVIIGENTVIAALVGIAGSSVIGDQVVIGGQAGVKDHVEIGTKATIAGRAGVIGNIPPNCLVSGFPAHLHREELKLQVLIRKLPEIYQKLKFLEKKIKELH